MGSLLTVTMGEKLLQLHMTSDTHKQRARAISEELTKDFFHHGYPVNRSEAKEIGLKVADRDEELEELMWSIWCDISEELKLREPHNPIAVLRDDPNCALLFSPMPVVAIPAGLPPPLVQQALQAVLQQVQIDHVPPALYENVHAVMESSRYASRYVLKGMIFASRQADQQLRLATMVERQGWVTSLSDTPAAPKQAAAPSKRAARRPSKRAARRAMK